MYWVLGCIGREVRLGSESSSGAEVTTLFCSYNCQNAFDGQETFIWIVTIQVLPPIMLFSGASLGSPASLGTGCCWILAQILESSGMGFQAAIEPQSKSQPNSLELCHLREFVRQSFLSFLLAGRALTYICRQKKTKDILMENHGSARMNHMRNAWSHEAELNKNIMSIYAPTQTEAHGNTISRIS